METEELAISPEEVKQDVNIDINNLEKEVVTQSSLYFKYSKEVANITADRDRIKLELDALKAKLSIDIRTDPKPSLKLTEALVEALIEKDEKVQELKQELISINNELNIFISVKSALEHKKSMLDNIIRMYQTGYWAELPVPNTQAIEERQAELAVSANLNQNPRLKRVKTN